MATDRNPTPSTGLAILARSPRLVLAAWAVPILVTLPFVLAVQAAFAPVLGSLPADPAPGDLQLILAGTLARTGPVLAVLALLAVPALWAWTVLWHAGLTGWRTWAAGRPQRLGEVLGLGLGRWWRYARFSFAALAATGAVMAIVWIPTAHLAKAATARLDETASVRLVLGGAALTVLLLLLLWAATLRGLWELAVQGRRSAALAWLRGLGGTLRHPLSSLGTLLLWAAALAVLWAGSLAAVRAMGPLGAGPAGVAVIQLAALLRAICWVGLAGSFAPVAGLGPLPGLGSPGRPRAAAPQRPAPAEGSPEAAAPSS